MPNAAALAAGTCRADRRPIAVTIPIVCVPLGATLAGLLGIRALPLLGWRTLFVLAGSCPIVAAVALTRVLPDCRATSRAIRSDGASWPRMMRRMGHPVAADSRLHGFRRPVRRPRVDRRRCSCPSSAATPSRSGARSSRACWRVYLGFSWLTSLLTGAGFDPGTANTGITAFNLGGVVGALLGGLAIARFGSRAAMLTMTAGRGRRRAVG